eukprot:TRINITY_DN18672_c1_g5_i1.p2 TRINITY_DN18672_c1_g5~~TRINITY_DN18672_c1_g5_i1.p2  ORF type:complete len:316 (-),score=107.67 TRINITY_DN18672_c1_g5_i1:1484-2431(-)
MARKEDDCYRINTPVSKKTEPEKSGSSPSPEMEALFDKFFMKFSQEMRDIVGVLGSKVEEQNKELMKQREEINNLTHRLAELEERGAGGGDPAKGDVGRGHMQEKMQDMISKAIEETQEHAKRICQLRITGLKEEDRESVTLLKANVTEIFEKKMQVEGAGAMVVDVFRLGKNGEDKYGRPRIVVARLGSVGQRNEILKGKRNLREWKELGVDVWRTKEEMEVFKVEMKKKKEVELKGGKAVLIRGKMVVLEATKDEKEGEEEEECSDKEGEGRQWRQVQHHRKGKKKMQELDEGGSAPIVYERKRGQAVQKKTS